MDKKTSNEIEKVAWTILRDAGQIRPPVSIEPILSHLDLYREYFDLRNPGFLDRAKYRLKVDGKKLIRVLDIVQLQAVLFGDEKRIVVDENLPPLKREWPAFHEIGHRILRWHHPYFFGDTAQTLDPGWQERLEAEANLAASSLMFCGPVFRREALDMEPQWSSVRVLKERYRKSWVTTVRRFVEHGPDAPMAMLVSTPPWMEVPKDQSSRTRHFVTSEKFGTMFSPFIEGRLLDQLEANVQFRRGGMVADFSFDLVSRGSDVHEVRAETFFNTHYLVTLFVVQKRIASTFPSLAQTPNGHIEVVGGRR